MLDFFARTMLCAANSASLHPPGIKSERPRRPGAPVTNTFNLDFTRILIYVPAIEIQPYSLKAYLQKRMRVWLRHGHLEWLRKRWKRGLPKLLLWRILATMKMWWDRHTSYVSALTLPQLLKVICPSLPVFFWFFYCSIPLSSFSEKVKWISDSQLKFQ